MDVVKRLGICMCIAVLLAVGSRAESRRAVPREAHGSTVADALRPYAETIISVSRDNGLDPNLVGAVILQESGGDAYAFRPGTRDWWSRHGKRAVADAKRSPSKHDDRWVQYPEMAGGSWGLMQPLYITARAYGFDPRYPSGLCDPRLNIEVGAAVLSDGIRRRGSIRGGLLAYNGGGRPAYASEVLAKRDLIRATGLFPTINGASTP